MQETPPFEADYVAWAAVWAQRPAEERIPFAVTSLVEARKRTGMTTVELVEQAQHQLNVTWVNLRG